MTQLKMSYIMDNNSRGQAKTFIAWPRIFRLLNKLSNK